ncbi:MAG: hypothetical protein PWP66_136 [Thermosediminibacterales bacterium]|nr:hypothetical protein [Thermosediminibacterales bacterium]MDK2901380.1 hypothetical protein [Thermosediminibacterales bacterium]
MNKTIWKKIFSFILTAAGLGIIITTLPYWVWTSFLGIIFMWVGWVLYRTSN